MAEVASADSEQRGHTVIADTVVQRIAAYAAAEVEGVAGVASGLDRVIGRQLPKVDARVAGTRTRVHVHVAVSWPSPLPVVAASVREHVSQRLRDLTGLAVDAVDVDVARVVPAAEPPQRRVQ